jgi:AcrR family transcriptional regulator
MTVANMTNLAGSVAKSGGVAKRMPLREQYRLLGEEAILNAAQEHFLRFGYRKTTMGTIANAAGVGVATVFRHFRSKEGVLAALSGRDINKSLADARAAITPPPPAPPQGILKLLSAVLGMHLMPSTKIRGQTRLWLLIPTGHHETDKVVTSSDLRLQEMIQELLAHYRAAGLLRADIDLRDATINIFAVFYHHYLIIALNRGMRIADVEIELRRRIPLLFEAWTASSPSVKRRGKTSRRSSH